MLPHMEYVLRHRNFMSYEAKTLVGHVHITIKMGDVQLRYFLLLIFLKMKKSVAFLFILFLGGIIELLV